MLYIISSDAVIFGGIAFFISPRAFSKYSSKLPRSLSVAAGGTSGYTLYKNEYRPRQMNLADGFQQPM